MRSIKTNDFTIYEATPEEFTIMLELAHLRNKLIVEHILEAFNLFTHDQIEIAEWEKRAMPYLCQIALVVDEMYLRWRTNVFPKEAYKMSEEVRPSFNLGVLRHCNDPFSVVDKTPGGYYFQVPYKETFGKEVTKIVKYLSDLLSILESYRHLEDCKSFTAYITALKDAYEVGECIKIGTLWLSEIKWREVDRKWLRYKGKLQIWHSMEYGYNKNLDLSGIRVIPEFRVTYLNESKDIDKINTYIKLLQGSHVNYFWKKYYDNDKILKMLDHVRDCDIGIHDTIVGGGSSLDFCPHGQVGPNDSVVGRQGFKSSLDIMRQEETYNKEKFIIGSICTIDTTVEINEWMLSTFENVGVYIGSHELSHPLFGDWGELEEFKASWTGIVPLEEEETLCVFRANILRDTLFSHLLCCIRYLISEDRTDPYFIEAVINMHFLFESKVFEKSGDGKWNIHLENLLETDKSYFTMTKDYYVQLLDLALQGKREQLLEEGKKAVLYSDDMEKLIQDVRNANILYYSNKKKDK